MRKTSFPQKRTLLKSFNSTLADKSDLKDPVLACLGSKLDHENVRELDNKAHTPGSSSLLKKRAVQPSKNMTVNTTTPHSPSPINSPLQLSHLLQNQSILKLQNESPVIQLASVPQRFETTPDITSESTPNKKPARGKKLGLNRYLVSSYRKNSPKNRIDASGLQISSFSPRLESYVEQSDQVVVEEKRIVKKSNVIQPISPIGSFSLRKKGLADISKTNWSLLQTSSYGPSNLEARKSLSPSIPKAKPSPSPGPESTSMKVLSSILHQPTASYGRKNIKSQQQQPFWKDLAKTEKSSYKIDSPSECATITNITPQNFLTEEFVEVEENTKQKNKEEIAGQFSRQNLSSVSFTLPAQQSYRDKKFLIPNQNQNQNFESIYELGDTSLYTIFEKKVPIDSQAFPLNPFLKKDVGFGGRSEISLLKSIKFRNHNHRKNSAFNNSGQIIVGSNFQKPNSPIHSNPPKMRFKKELRLSTNY